MRTSFESPSTLSLKELRFNCPYKAKKISSRALTHVLLNSSTSDYSTISATISTVT